MLGGDNMKKFKVTFKLDSLILVKEIEQSDFQRCAVDANVAISHVQRSDLFNICMILSIVEINDSV